MVNILQLLFYNMCVDLCGGNVCVAQHLLNRVQVCPVFQQMRSKGVAQHMGRNVLFDFCLLLIILYDFPKALPRHALSVHVHKQRLFLVAGYDPFPDVRDIILECLHRTGI